MLVGVDGNQWPGEQLKGDSRGLHRDGVHNREIKGDGKYEM